MVKAFKQNFFANHAGNAVKISFFLDPELKIMV